jgi:hypothetical protein
VLAGILIDSFSLLIFCNSSIIPPQQKVPNVSNRGSLLIPALWPFAEGLFSFCIYFPEKEGFLISCIVYIK